MVENPGTDKVDDLLRNVHDGLYVIPYFQRGFEWQPSMVCDLIESILQNYYAGLILLWELKSEEAKHGKWEPIWGAELNEPPKKAILDGQQRLASLYYAIYNPKKIFPNRQSYYLFFLNLNKILNDDYEEAVTYRYYFQTHQSWDDIRTNKDKWAETGIIPLSILSAKDPNNSAQKYIDSTEFDNWLTDYVNKNRDDLPEGITTHKVYQVLNGILNYNFVFYPLSKDRKPPDICNIFARVNAKGMKLSTFDLMNAFLYPKGLNLRKDLWENLDNNILKDIDANMHEYLLKLISLIKQNYCSSKYIYNLIPGEKTIRKDEYGKKHEEILVQDGEKFKSLWEDSCKYAEEARKIIMNTGSSYFGAIKTDFIPNTTIVPVLGAILWEYKEHNGDYDHIYFKNELKKWYWSAVFSEDYSGSSDSVMAKDFRDWKEWISNKKSIERINRISQEFISELDLKNVRRGSARYKAILCILALNEAKDFYNELQLGAGDFSKENIDDHHIFPKQIKGLDPEKSKTFNDLKDSIVNKTLLYNETNNIITNKKPSEYIAEMIGKHGDEHKVKLILQGHLITDKAFRYMKEDDFDKFVIERENAIKEHIIPTLGILNQNFVEQGRKILQEESVGVGQRQKAERIIKEWLEKIEGNVFCWLDYIDETTISYLNNLPRTCSIRIITSKIQNKNRFKTEASKLGKIIPKLEIKEVSVSKNSSVEPQKFYEKAIIHKRKLVSNNIMIDFGTDLKSSALGNTKHDMVLMKGNPSDKELFDEEWNRSESEWERIEGIGIKVTHDKWPN